MKSVSCSTSFNTKTRRDTLRVLGPSPSFNNAEREEINGLNPGNTLTSAALLFDTVVAIIIKWSRQKQAIPGIILSY